MVVREEAVVNIVYLHKIIMCFEKAVFLLVVVKMDKRRNRKSSS